MGDPTPEAVALAIRGTVLQRGGAIKSRVSELLAAFAFSSNTSEAASQIEAALSGVALSVEPCLAGMEPKARVKVRSTGDMPGTVSLRVEDIPIHTGDPDTPFRMIAPVSVVLGPQTGIGRMVQKPPTLEEANSRLREAAVQVGANAIVRVEYQRGALVGKRLKATGTAVITETRGRTK